MKTYFQALCLGLVLLPGSVLFSQDKIPAKGMQSGKASFTILTSRPMKQVSAEQLRLSSEKEKMHPEFGVLPINAPCKDCYEVIEKRTEDSRHFVINGTNGNTFFNQKSLGAINYKDKSGLYLEKDINIYANPEAGIFSSSHQAEPIEINLNSQLVSIKTLDNVDIKINNKLELWGMDKQGNEKMISKADWSSATVGSNGLRVTNVFKGISLEAIALSGSVKTNFIIDSYLPSFSEFKWLIIKDNITEGTDNRIQFTGMADKSGLYNSDADIISGVNQLVGKVHQGVIYDESRANTFSLFYKQNGNKLEMYIDVDYLKNNSISYPVTVDPLVTSSATLAQASITGSQYNASCNFTNSCDFNLVVNSPANATITDVTFSMAYQALGACYQQDGAMRIGYSSCISPNLAGYYWFCNVIGTGTCTGTNLSVFSDIAACIPAPSCAPVPMTFTLKMYRSCWGTSGCTANCIRAAAPWVMNVMGKTLETLSNTTTGNGTTTQVAACTGTAALNPTPLYGVGPFTYVWNPGGAVTPGYTVTGISTTQTITCNVTDACGVVRTATFTVNPNPAVPSVASLPTKTLTSCAPNATFTPAYTSGSAITTYAWSGPGIVGASNGANVTVNQAGIYTVTFTNSAGCSASNTYTAVDGPVTATASALSSTISCANTSVTLSPTYTPPNDLTYSWTSVGPGSISGSSVSPNVVITQPGTYQVTLTNTITGCQNSTTYTVTDATQTPTISSIATQSITCTAPTVTLNPSYNPSSGLTYSWSGPSLSAATSSVTVTQAGTYTVIATAANGCTSTAQYSVVDQSALPTVSIQGGTLTCSGPLTLSTTVNPGSGTYTYTWTGSGITSGVNGNTVTVNAAGDYSVTITNAFGCTASNSYSVMANTNIPTASVVSGTITCTNATATLSPVYTPSSDLTYSWTVVGAGTIVGSNTNADVVVSQSGVYQVSFTNTVTNCQNTATYTVTDDTQVPTISAIADQTITCTTATINLDPVYTPTTGLTYSWSGPGLSTNTASVSVTQAGTFTVLATAANGCTATAQYNVSDESALPTVSIQGGTLTCSGPLTLSTTVNPGSGTYTYTWTGSGITSGVNGNTVTVNAAGDYSVTITNAFGCTATNSYSVMANTNIPTASVVSGTITCTNATATLSPVYTPSSDLTYSWTVVGAGTIVGSNTNADVVVSQSGVYQVSFTNTVTNCQSSATYTVTDDTQAPTISAIADQTITCTTATINLDPVYTPTTGLTYSWSGPGLSTNTASVSVTQGGTFTVLATAANGCTATTQYNVIDNSALPTVSIQGGTLSCSGPLTLSTTVNPGSGTYTYTWTGSGITSGVNSNTATVNAAGNYTITITNAFGCNATATYSVIGDTNIPTASVVSGTITCTNTTATLSPVYTPSSDLTYSWTVVGAGTIVGSNTNADVVVSQSGVYQVSFTNTVTNCQSSATYTVTDDTQVPTISAIADQTLTCTTATINLDPVYTPTTGLTYSWSGPGLSTNTASVSVTQGGTFTVLATAANGCTATAQYNVIDNSALPTVSIQGGTLSCSGPLTLSTTVNPGSGTYTYTWTGSGITSGVNGNTVTVNAAGDYSVAITNAFGCSANASYSVSGNSNIPTASAASGTITCSSPNATLSPVYTPSTGLTYSWTVVGAGTIVGSNTNAAVVVSQSGVYQVTMTNSVTNCQSSNTYTVFSNTAVPSISSIPTQTITCAVTSASLNPTYTPATGLTYSWSGPGITPPVTSAGITTSQAGTFTVVATAANGCMASAQYSVISNTTTLLATTQSTALPCDGTPVSLGVSMTPVGTYTYSWSGPGIVSGGSSATPLVNAAGNYTVTVTNAGGCSTSTVVNVTSQAVAAAFTPVTAEGSAPFAVNFTDQSSNATSWLWSFGDGNGSVAQNPSNAYLSTGVYNVMLVAYNGACTDTAYGTITVQDASMIEVPNVFTPNSDRVNDVFSVRTAGIKDLELTIFNRWGEKLFSGSGVNAFWNGENNGKAVAEGTYFYLVKATGYDDKEYEQQGTVNLFR